MALIEPPEVFGRYHLVEKIGQGGMAEIFKAKAYGAQGFEKLLVIKRILPALLKDPNFVKMFVDEAKLTVNLNHSNIVQVYELGDVGGQLYITMEYVAGQDLFNTIDAGIRRKMPLPEDLAIHILVEMLRGLDYAHRAKSPDGSTLNIVHRDISPTNIFVSYEGDVKLADFGIAKANMVRQQTQVGAIKGTLGYMSPEQVQGQDLDARSDIFVSGILLYELMTNKKPFFGKTDLDILLRIRDAKFPTPSAARKDIPPVVEKIVLRAMTQKPEKRYQTAGEFADELANYLFAAGMRVSQRKLTTFMKSLFAEEHKQEGLKLKRIFGTAPVPLVKPEAPAPPPPQPPSAAASPPEEASFATLITDIHEAQAAAAAAASPIMEQPPAPPPESAQFYLRDAKSGTTVGPVTIATVFELARLKKLKLSEEVSIDGVNWRPITHFPFPARVVRAIRAIQSERYRTGIQQRPASNLRPAIGAGSATISGPVPAVRTGVTSAVAPGQPRPKYSGLFSEVSPTRLLYRFAGARETGRLELRRGQVIKHIYLRDGLPEYIRSNVEVEKLGEFLVKREAITRDQLNIAFHNLAKHQGRLGDALLAMNALPSHELYRLLAEQVRAKLLEIFAWRDGTYSFYEGEMTTSEVIPLGIGSFAILTEGVRTAMAKDELVQYFHGKFDLPIKLRRNMVLEVDALKLSPKEMRVVRAVDATKSLNDLVYLVALSNEEMVIVLYRTIYLLNEVELVAIG